MNSRKPQSLALRIVLVWIGFFAGWTVGSVPLTLIGAPFASLAIAFATAIAGAMMGWSLHYRILPVTDSLQNLLPLAEFPHRREVVLWICGVLIFAVTAAFFIKTSNAIPMWGAILILAVCSLFNKSQINQYQTALRNCSSGAFNSGLCILAGGIWLIYFLLLRPDGDDAFYLNLPIGIKSAAHGMMVWDTMHGHAELPILGSNYRVESLPTLIAAVSWITNISVATVAHLIIPTIWCIVLAAALSVIGYSFFGSRWWMFAVLSVLSTMLFPETLQSWGAHGITRLFHGKAPLILIIVPLTIFFAAKMDRSGLDFKTSLGVLTLLQCAALGLTSNAIYLAPLVLGVSLVAGLMERSGGEAKRLLLLASTLPPVIAGIWLLSFDKPVPVSQVFPVSFVDIGIWNLAASKVSLGLLLAIALVAALACRICKSAWITSFLIITLLCVLNPFLWPIYDRFCYGWFKFSTMVGGACSNIFCRIFNLDKSINK